MKCKELGVDPFDLLLLYAKGDWKALGLDDEFEYRFSQEGGKIKVRAISLEMRLRAIIEAVQYLEPKRKAIDVTTDGKAVDFSPVIVIPANGREAQIAPRDPARELETIDVTPTD